MFSILIPTFNNLDYLKICLSSIKKNSKFDHQIIVHVNVGTDGTLEYLKDNKIDHTFSSTNSGMPKALNTASIKSSYSYIVMAHDDFYFCPGWDEIFIKEIKNYNHNNFYLSGTMVGPEGCGQVVFDAGQTAKLFNESLLLSSFNKIKTINFQGSTKCPGLVHKDVWKKVGGWSEEFFPTGGDDTDFAKKLWDTGIRIFKGLGECSVYHFGSITTRKKSKNLFTYLGSKGNKIFLKKWGITINFFEKYYLKSGLDKNKKLNFKQYDGPLTEPNKNFNYFISLIKCKISLFYLNIFKF